jgi:hypothetical protein
MLVDGPHFQATNEGELVFLRSNGDTSRRPDGHEVLESEEEERTVQQKLLSLRPARPPRFASMARGDRKVPRATRPAVRTTH